MKLLKDNFIIDVKLGRNGETTTMPKLCDGCHEQIEAHSWYYYGRGRFNDEDCVFHKFCGELPLKIAHPLHHHSVEARTMSKAFCAFCDRSSGELGMIYNCYFCMFYVCLLCAVDDAIKLLSSKSPKEIDKMTLKDLGHHHPLKLLTIQNHPDDEDVDNVVAILQHCQACLQPIIDSTYYICTEESEACKGYSLHEFCAELPLEIKHDLHQLHPLMLMLSPPPEHFNCFACRKFCRGHIYSCRFCYFQLDIICATATSRVLEHKCHPHPLTLLPMSNSSLFCSACSNVHEGIFFQCTVCLVFFVHQDCASRGYVILHKSHPGHPLRLGFCSSAIDSINDCDICYVRIIDKSGWFYYCEECKFYAHLNCITSSENDQEVQEIGREIPCLPWEETHNEFGTVGLLTRNLKSIQNYEGSEVVMISHFSHPQHPLVLQTDVPKEANPYSDGEIIIVTTQCNGCTKQISAPLYSCVSCHFYIHKGCALLPSSIPQHHSHSNDGHYCRLVLLREPWSETQVFECKICWNYCNGFCYQCEEESCGYTFDVECASLPITIVHKAHPFHPLQLVKFREFGWKRWAQSDNRVKCCLEKRNVDIYVYVCDICGIMIHATCAMYPGKAHHRFDCRSPFTLNYDSSLIEPNAFHYCDICEEILDPKKWFYFSPKNGFQVIHPWCIFLIYRAAVERPNFKSISSLFEFDIHPHILHLYAANHFSKCYHCKIAMAYHKKTEVQGPCSLSYQCGDCIYELHITCANKLFLPAKEDVEETADKGISTIAGNIQKLYLEGSDSTGVGGNPDTVSSTSKGKEILDHQSSSNDYAAVLQKLFFEEIGSTGLEEDPDDATTSKGK